MNPPQPRVVARFRILYFLYLFYLLYFLSFLP